VDLIAVNALLRHQLALLKRQSKQPRLKPADRLSLLVLAKVTKTWRQALLIVQPATRSLGQIRLINRFGGLRLTNRVTFCGFGHGAYTCAMAGQSASMAQFN